MISYTTKRFRKLLTELPKEIQKQAKDAYTYFKKDFYHPGLRFKRVHFTIKENLPHTHELQSHELYPGIKFNAAPIFIVEDDTTGNRLLIDFKNIEFHLVNAN